MAAGKDAFIKITPCLLPLLISPGCRGRSIAAANKSVVVLGVDGMARTSWSATGMSCLTSIVCAGKANSSARKPACRRGARYRGLLSSPAASGRPRSLRFCSSRSQNHDAGFRISMAAQGSRSISLGSYELPLPWGKVISFRIGTPFWQILSQHHIPTEAVPMLTDLVPVHWARQILRRCR